MKKCLRFKDCKNFIYLDKCKSCGKDYLNYESNKPIKSNPSYCGTEPGN